MIRVIVFLVLFMSSLFLGAQTISTDRPDQTEGSTSVPQGSLQIEAGFLHELSEIDDIKVLHVLVPTTLFRYGVAKGLELRLVGQFESFRNRETHQTVDGLSNVELGAKLELLNKEEIKTKIAFLSHAVLPIGSDELSNNKLGTVNKLSISHELNAKLSLGYNVGYDYFGEGSGNFNYSMALGLSIYDNFGVYIEPYGEVVDFKTHLASFDAGITYLLADNIQLDFSSGVGLNYDMDYIAVGFSINIPKKDRHQ